MTYRDALGLTEGEYSDLLELTHERSYRERSYRYLPDRRGDFDRGLVLIDGHVVAGFPKIPRALVLGESVPRHFGGNRSEGGGRSDDGERPPAEPGAERRSDADAADEVVVEEKLNGYNVRIALVDEPLAFTRSGIVCPFTTHEVRRLLDLESFFGDRPEATLCGEMIGPENPYTAHDYPGVESIAFRAFDVRDGETGESLPIAERRELCERHGVPQVPHHGTFPVEEAAAAVDEIVRELDDEGREGVVMKSPDAARQLKYTTGGTNRADLAYAFSLPFDHGRDFMFRRIVREAFQSAERGEDETERRERARDLGESILLSFAGAVDAVDAGETLGERHTVRSDPEVVDRLLAHLHGLGLKVVIEDDRTVDGERVVTFLKRLQSTNDKIRMYLDGHVVEE